MARNTFPAALAALSALLLAAVAAAPAGGADATPAADPAASLTPASGFEFVPTGSLVRSRHHHIARLLADGSVLIHGGSDDELDDGSEVWDPATGQFRLVPPGEALPAVFATPPPPLGVLAPERGESRTLLLDGRVLIAGGFVMIDPLCRGVCETVDLAAAELLDPATGESVPLAPMTVPRTGHSATLLLDGRVLIVGSHTHGDTDRTAELFQPVP